MLTKLVPLKFILLVFVTFTSQITTAQERSKKAILLTVLLDKISNDHKIFFTYNAELLKNKYIQAEGFASLTLKESISLLKKITPFLLDDLGNNYYVIYQKKGGIKRTSHPKNKIDFLKIVIETAVLGRIIKYLFEVSF